MTDTEKLKLPALPLETQWKYRTTGYTAQQMREYAQLAIKEALAQIKQEQSCQQ